MPDQKPSPANNRTLQERRVITQFKYQEGYFKTFYWPTENSDLHKRVMKLTKEEGLATGWYYIGRWNDDPKKFYLKGPYQNVDRARLMAMAWATEKQGLIGKIPKIWGDKPEKKRL